MATALAIITSVATTMVTNPATTVATVIDMALTEAMVTTTAINSQTSGHLTNLATVASLATPGMISTQLLPTLILELGHLMASQQDLSA